MNVASADGVSIARVEVTTATATGKSHVQRLRDSDDAVGWKCSEDQPFEAIVAVADGHSDSRCFRSRAGAAFAVEAAHETQGVTPHAVASRLVNGWRRRVDDDIERFPFTQAELHSSADLAQNWRLAYGTTALMCRITNAAMVIVQIGDGDVIAVHADGRASRPVPPATAVASELTHSLSQRDAQAVTRSVQLTAADAPALLILASDGLDNAYPSSDSMLKAATELFELRRSSSLPLSAAVLDRWAADAADISGDDATVAAVWVETVRGGA